MIYFDNAATMPIDPDVLKAVNAVQAECFGNPSSIHSAGRSARALIDTARKQCAAALHCSPSQIFFTSGATESDEWGMRLMRNYCESREWLSDRISYYTSPIEHKAVLNNLNPGTKSIEVDRKGRADIRKLAQNMAHSPNTFGISVMWVNNEIGTVQPIEMLSQLCDKHSAYLHVDAVQAVGKAYINLKELKGIASLAISGHKIGAPKGIGLLYIRDPEAKYVQPLIRGGGQQSGLRSGTENVAGIVGLGAAMEKIRKSSVIRRCTVDESLVLKQSLMEGILLGIEDSMLNGNCDEQLPYFINISFKGIEGETLLLALDRRGICVSSGSACNGGTLRPSYVLKAIGVPDDYINGTIRITLSDSNTMEECKAVAEAIKEEVARLRSISPNWKGGDNI